MTDPTSYSFATPRLGLPLLFAGQSQKEVTVNEALATIDLLLPGAVEGVISVPPTAPVSGNCWIVGSGPSGAFSGRTGQLAGLSEGGWRFVTPVSGMRVYDREAAAIRVFTDEWLLAASPSAPVGGAVIDTEARATLEALVAALRQLGIISTS